MPAKANEIPQGSHLPPCPGPSGICSVHRRTDRVYEDRVWAWSLAHPGVSPFVKTEES